MHLSSLGGVAFLGLVLFMLREWSVDPDVHQAERTVFATAFYSVLGGTAVNTICAAVTWSVGAVPYGEEFGACSPYGLAGSAVSARLHMYRINGYGPNEWKFVKMLPQVFVMKMGGAVDRTLTRLDEELYARGIISKMPKSKARMKAHLHEL